MNDNNPVKPDQQNNTGGGTNNKPDENKNQPGQGVNSKLDPTLKAEDQLSKEIWGHLPDRVRQKAFQYYREQYMDRYSELLKKYYSSLAEREEADKKK